MNLQTYNAAHEAAVWRDMSHFGRFRVSGREAATLLHHLTTNDIKGLKDGQGCDTALISSKARLLDWLWIFRLDGEFLVITSPNRREMFSAHARQFVLFRQDVKIEDVSDSTGLCAVFGPATREALGWIGGFEAMDTSLNAPLHLQEDELSFWVSRTERLPQGGVLLWSNDAAGLAAQSRGEAALLPCDGPTYNVLRVEAGLPAAGLELTEEFNPWEARLDDSISLHKGCYNGQEIVARLNTYQKVKQRLCRLKFDALPPERAALRIEGRASGLVTSAVMSPRFGPIGLGYVRNAFLEAGQKCEVEGGGQAVIVEPSAFSDQASVTAHPES